MRDSSNTTAIFFDRQQGTYIVNITYLISKIMKVIIGYGIICTDFCTGEQHTLGTVATLEEANEVLDQIRSLDYIQNKGIYPIETEEIDEIVMLARRINAATISEVADSLMNKD